MTAIFPPIAYFTDSDGRALDEGQIYVGTAGMDARANPIQVYWDEALTIPADQPIQTIAGFPTYQGTPSAIYIDATVCSVTALDRKGVPIYTNKDTQLYPASAASVSFIQAGAGAVERTALSKMRERISVADFGAVGDDATDATAAIQAACDSLSVTGGVIDFVPAGTYVISGTITVPDNIRFIGHGATVRQTVDLTTMFDVTNSPNVKFEYLTFQDTGAGYIDSDAQPHAAISTEGGSDGLDVDHCQFTDITFAGLRIRDTDGYNVSGNKFVGPGSSVLSPGSNLRCYPILIDDGCLNYRVIGNDISEALHGMRVAFSPSGVIALNVIHNIPAQHGIYAGPDMSGVVIAGNVFRDIELQAIKLQVEAGLGDITDVTITGNTITTCDQGITLSHAAGGTSQTEKLRNIVVADNTITDCAALGLNIQNVVVGRVADNIVTGCGTSGVSYSACEHLVITKNQVSNTTQSGIRDQTVGTSIFITDNVLINVATGAVSNDNFGIFIQNLSSHTIRGNTIVTAVPATMLYGIYLAAGDQTNSIVENNQVSGGTYGIRVASSLTAFKSYKNNAFEGATAAAFNVPALPSVASVAAMTLTTQQDVFLVTGTTGITSIVAGGHTGHRVTLVFQSSLTVTRGSNLILNQSAGNFSATANDTLTLTSDGSNWYEISRSGN